MKIAFTLVLLLLTSIVSGQQFSLYNSMTLYDSFENPSQRAFQADSSRKFAFNLLIPTASFNGRFSGPAQRNFQSFFFKDSVDGRNLEIGQGAMNNISAHSNTYMFMLRIFRAVGYNSEVGFSWQIRNDGRGKVSNETFAIFDTYDRFMGENTYTDIFNNSGYNQSYNQYSFSYREDFDKRASIGFKLSLLSGITYNSLDIDWSRLDIRRDLREYDVLLRGNFKSNILESDFDRRLIRPTFHDPGLSLSLGGSYKFRGGWFLMGNLKDIGFIKWNKDSYNYDFDDKVKVERADATSDAHKLLRNRIDRMLRNNRENKEFTTMVNGKAEALLNRNFGPYKPNFIISKSLFYDGGHVALVNNYHWRNLVLTATGDYNLDKYFLLGGQFMIKSPNVEFFLGSDHLLGTYQASRRLISADPELDNSISSASAYIGFGLKFGRIIEHEPNSNFIPGMNANHDRAGIFRRLFGRR
jgi:hypothetical protein